MEWKLPIIAIEGTDFMVDIRLQELREVANPENKISFLEMNDLGTHYAMEYDPKVKNLPDFFGKGKKVTVPQMVELDPIAMAEHHGLTVKSLVGKTDFDILVNQDLVKKRLKGALPIIDIAGHPFYVDIRIGSLRPKDDFRTMGIQFSDIEHCLTDDEKVYQITYDPRNKTFVDVDFGKITAIPERIIIVEIPHQSELDPIGYARKLGVDPKDILRAFPPVNHMKAKVVPWAETPIKEIIDLNLKKSIKPERKRSRRL